MKTISLAAAVAVVSLAGSASATVSVGPTVGGLATFTESTTGRNWVRMDTYYSRSYNYMATDLVNRGFTLATRQDVDALFAAVDIALVFPDVYQIMGSPIEMAIIIGAYSPQDPDGKINVVFGGEGLEWTFSKYSTDPDTAFRPAYVNFWAFVEADGGGGGGGGGGAVPEPSSWAMLIAGFGLVGAAARRRRAASA
jgi:PEP-CTERM motif